MAVAVGVPLLELRMRCAVPDSEGCVWARALLPVSFGMGGALGLFAAGVVFFAFRGIGRR
jgi:hypothetical protein